MTFDISLTGVGSIPIEASSREEALEKVSKLSLSELAKHIYNIEVDDFPLSQEEEDDYSLDYYDGDEYSESL